MNPKVYVKYCLGLVLRFHQVDSGVKKAEMIIIPIKGVRL